MHDDGSLTATAFKEIGILVEDTQATPDATLNKADTFMSVCLERARLAAEAEDVKA